MADDDHPQHGKDGGSRFQPSPGFIGGTILVVLLVIFALQNNSNKVSIHWLFFTHTSTVLFTIIATAVVTLLAERLVVWDLRRRRKRRDHDDD
jgi:uncharacterized integral membrane protein